MSLSDHEIEILRVQLEEKKRKGIEQIRSSLDVLNWESEQERRKFINDLLSLICDWTEELPNLRDILWPQAIERLLFDVIKFSRESIELFIAALRFVTLLTSTDYKDELQVYENGRPVLHRTTPVHLAARLATFPIRELFKIYDKFDVNFTDELGLTHFHVACEHGFVEIVEKFLEFGQDPNVLKPETGDSPLHLALDRSQSSVVELLLRSGADQNLANARGTTPLHILCSERNSKADGLIQLFFEINDERLQRVRIDASDVYDNTPLHLAMQSGYEYAARLLLRRGANPNLENRYGFTPLHVVCRRDDDADNLAELLLTDDRRSVQVDAADNLGWTPLDWAAVSLNPDVFDVLLNHGAELSSFVFPTESQFDVHFNSNAIITNEKKLDLTSRILSVVQHLKVRKYQLDLSDVLTIMEFFSKLGFLEMSGNIDEFLNYPMFVMETKKVMVRPGRSLYDFIRLPNDEAANSFSLKHFKITRRFLSNLSDSAREAVDMKMVAILLRRHFRNWVISLVRELTHRRLPNACCGMIVDYLSNEDLRSIFSTFV